MTAYEELKAWCEKHLKPEEYKVVPETPSYCATIYFDNYGSQTYVCFRDNGDYAGTGEIDTDEMTDHLLEYNPKEA